MKSIVYIILGLFIISCGECNDCDLTSSNNEPQPVSSPCPLPPVTPPSPPSTLPTPCPPAPPKPTPPPCPPKPKCEIKKIKVCKKSCHNKCHKSCKSHEHCSYVEVKVCK